MPQKWGFGRAFRTKVNKNLIFLHMPLTICGKNKVLITPFFGKFYLKSLCGECLRNSCRDHKCRTSLRIRKRVGHLSDIMVLALCGKRVILNKKAYRPS